MTSPAIESLPPLLYNDLDLQVDSNCIVSALNPSIASAAVLDELAELNKLHRELAALNTPATLTFNAHSPAQPNTNAPAPGTKVVLERVPPPPMPVAPQRSAQVEKLRDSGNTLFRKLKYDDALRPYSIAIGMALSRPLWEASHLVREEGSALFSNRAQTHVQLQQWGAAAADARCSVELKRGPGNTKAWYRRGKALLEMGRLREAEKWLVEAVDVEAGDKELLELLATVRQKL